ncbi:MAG: arylesterase [Myxococcota bacterium]
MKVFFRCGLGGGREPRVPNGAGQERGTRGRTTFARRLGEASNAGAPKGYPLVRSLAIALACVGVALGGDAAVAADEKPELRIVCLGDSLTEGYGLAPELAYPYLLEAALREQGHPARVVNAGISGSTSASAVGRLRWQLRSEPDIVILALGGNDGLRGVDVTATRKHLSEAIRLATDRGVRVLLAGMKMPPNYGPEYTRDFEALFPDLAEKHSVPLIPFLLEGVAADPKLNLPDGIHPNARGTEIMTQNVLSALLPMLAQEAGS